MANLREVHISGGVPDSGTGTVSTLDALIDAMQALIGESNSSLGEILAKIIAAPATEAKQDIANARLAGPTAGTITSVNDQASDVTILAANSSRKGATVFNDSAYVLYLALGSTTASSTNYTAKVFQDQAFHLPTDQGGVYTGVIKGIWAGDGSGAARVTERT